MRSRTARAALVTLPLLGCLASVALAGECETFHFAILGDRTGGHTEGIYPRVISEVALLHPDLVVTVGDHIEGYTDDTALANAEWDTVLGMLGRLGVPVYPTPGNHDITTDAAEPVYVQRTGRSPYYSFNYGSSHFVILDTSRIESSEALPEEQRAWLISDLAANQNAEHTFVFFHKPLWDMTLGGGKPDPLHEIFRKYGVDAVFCGHYHVYFSAEYDGIQYTVLSSSGADLGRGGTESVVRGQFYQFAWVTVEPSGFDVAVVGLGAVYPRDVVTRATQEEIARVDNELVSLGAVSAPEGTPAWTPVTVTVKNESDKTLEDAVGWKVPEGWEVDPAETPFAIPPGAAHEMAFRLLNRGDLYPAPHMTMDYPMPDGRLLDVDLAVPVTRTVAAASFRGRPTIDGVLDERCWQTAEPVSKLYPSYPEARVDGATTFLFGHDEKNLYVGVECRDAEMAKLVAEIADRDGSVFREDCVGFFLNPDPEAARVYQIYVSALGTVFDQSITFDENMHYTTDITWNGGYEVATKRGGDRWTAEIRIPFRELGKSASADHPWRLNFRRKQQRTQATADWQVPIDYNPRTFGEMLFR